jgi:hypothetical protein
MKRMALLVALVACKSSSKQVPATMSDAAAAKPAPPAPAVKLHTVRIPGVSGTPYFAPDEKSFWVQDDDGGNLVHVDLSGKELGRVALDGPLEQASLWVRAIFESRPVSPDGNQILEERTEPDDKDHTAFAVDLQKRTETALPVGEYAHVGWLPDGRLLVEDLDGATVALLDLATGKRATICDKVDPVLVRPTRDGKAVVVNTHAGAFLADFACNQTAPITNDPAAMPDESPDHAHWLALELVGEPGQDHSELHLVAPKPRTIGEASGAAWLDDDVVVYVANDRAVSMLASSDAPSAPILPDQPGCRDDFVTASPSGGVVTFSRGCGEGTGEMVVVTR